MARIGLADQIDLPRPPDHTLMWMDRALMARHARLTAWDRVATQLVTPSLLACDFAILRDELARLQESGTSAVHLDVMDGQFVPNFTYGPPVIASWREASDLPFDAHLMMISPGRYLDAFLEAGCDLITIHIEAVANPTAELKQIRDGGARAGLAINPGTSVSAILPWLDQIDLALVMSVEPGFGGQTFDSSVLQKIRDLRAARTDLHLSIDGGIKPTTAPLAVEAGVNQLVAGTSIFRPDGNYARGLAELQDAWKDRGGRPS